MTTPHKTPFAIIGCGNISSIYIENAYRLPNLHLVALADLDPARPLAKIEEIKTRHAQWNPAAPLHLPRAATVEELLADPKIDIILNLTLPKSHAAVALQCLAAGKHTYHEKPFALSRAQGQQILDAAQKANRRVGCAPDTFLGAALQTARKLLDDGLIGDPVAATAFMTCPGHESWHPDPEFYYQPGGGPMFDMGPYYLTALIHLLGPAQRITGFARSAFPTRTITSEKKRGTLIPVQTPTHIASTLQFHSGPLASLIMSFDILAANLPRIEIYGTKGSLSLPDPNHFDGDIKLKIGPNDWTPIPHTHPNARNSRGLGLSDMAYAITDNLPHRASAELAFHVLDIMQASLESAQSAHAINIPSTTKRPAPLPPNE